MFEIFKKNNVATLEPKKSFINNDINLNEYNLTAISTIIILSALFLISMRMIVITGTL